MSENSEILSITEVALNLRCSKAHVYNAINGKITAFPVARNSDGPPKACSPQFPGVVEISE